MDGNFGNETGVHKFPIDIWDAYIPHYNIYIFAD